MSATAMKQQLYFSKLLSAIYRSTRSALSFPESVIRSFPAQLYYLVISVWSGTTHMYLSFISHISEFSPSRSSMLWSQYAIWLIVQSCLVVCCYDSVSGDSRLTAQVPPCAVKLLLYVSIVFPAIFVGCRVSVVSCASVWPTAAPASRAHLALVTYLLSYRDVCTQLL